MVLEKTSESPLDCKEVQPVHRRGNQSWIFIGRTDVEAETKYFVHLMWRIDSFEKTLMLGKIEGGRRRGQQKMRCWMASPTQWTWVWVNSGSWSWTGSPGMLQSMGFQRVGHNWVIELNWQCLIDPHINISFDPAILLFEIYTEDIPLLIWNRMCTLFISVFFISTKDGK